MCILGCHIKRANGKLVDDTAEDACESTDAAKSCKAKYDKATGPNSKVNALCPPCLDATARATVFATIESQLDNGTNAAVYCAPGTPFGGDDQGNVPASKSNDQKCEDAVAKALAKASACILTCGTKLADGKLADDAAEDACELVQVTYQELTPVTNAETALDPKTPVIHASLGDIRRPSRSNCTPIEERLRPLERACEPTNPVPVEAGPAHSSRSLAA